MATMTGELALLGGVPKVTRPIPLWPAVGDAEIDAVVEALHRSRSDVQYLNSMPGGGPVAALEEQFAEHFGVRYALASASGAASLHMALYAIGVEAGDEVIVSPYTWGQTVSPILNQGAIPVFADIDQATYTLDPRAVEARITPYTRAILVVHIFGQPANMDGLLAVARRHKLPVIEDCAQATGARHRGQYVGTLADVGCFSFGDGKQIVGGDGGMVITNDSLIYQRACSISSHPVRQERDIQDPALTPYIDSLTYTYRIHPLASVIIQEELKRMDGWNAERRSNHHRLSQGLAGVPGLRPVAETPGGEHVYHRHSPTMVLDELTGVSRETIVAALEAEGVPSNLGYVRQPIHLRPRLQDRAYFFGRRYPWAAHRSGQGVDAVAYRAGDCPVAERRCAEEELDLLGMTAPAWRGDLHELVDQHVRAAQKVFEPANLAALRDWERSHESSSD
ncbi:MAG: pyridoxal-5'-phosphate-dependent protein [Dehalococcoidia bacterium]|nr:pyridoxal-5'-phosphate-dependent protein [Dehalococcoidia bacterium]